MSGIRLTDCSKLAINLKSDNGITICWYDVIVHFFWRCLVSLVRFSYWSMFHVNIFTALWVMTVFFYKGLTRNLLMGNTPVWGLSNIWRLGQVKHTKFSANVSDKMLLNAAKFQDYSFYCFWVIKGKPIGGKITPHSTQIRVNFVDSS